MRLFLDPGVTTGWALLDNQGNVKEWGQVTGVDSFTELITMIHRETPLEEIFYEPYVLRNSATKNMTRHQKKGHQDTLQIVGAIRSFCSIFKIEHKEIRDVTLKAAYAQAGLSMLPPAQHAESHQYDALAYARSYAIRNGLIKVPRRHT